MPVVTEAIRLRRMSLSGKKLLVACSGGVDSMVLLHALVAENLHPEVLHVNYQLRGNDSDADEMLVRQTAEELGLNVHVHHCPVALTKQKGVNLQSAARDFRRELFREWISRSEQHAVVLAHHLDDQVETFFLQYFRGSGLFGLGGMHSEKNGIIRPFLEVPKSALIAYATENGIAWREDQSNQSSNYLRNVFRNTLLPALKQEHPQLAEHCRIIMGHLRELQQTVREETAAAVNQWNEQQQLPVTTWQQFTSEQALAFAYGLGWPAWTVERLNQLAAGPDGKRIEIGKVTLYKEAGHFRTVSASEIHWEFKIEEIGILPKVWNKHALYLDAAVIDPTKLEYRSWQQGDRIRSLGMKGSQLVSDVLKDAGVPLSRREQYPVLVYDTEILWIPGIKVGRKGLAGPDSAVILKITVLKMGRKKPLVFG